jgi:UDP-glucose-4-epimerase GalE
MNRSTIQEKKPLLVAVTVTVAIAVLGAAATQFARAAESRANYTIQETPITEDHPKHPINAYGETKLAIERTLPHYERAYGLKAAVLRYFNAAGADPDGQLGEDHDPELHVIPRAIDAALGRDTFQIFGNDFETPDGTCLPDYIHVTDLADAHLRALESLRAGGPSASYNLGNGRPTSVKDVVRSVTRVVGRDVPVTIGPRREGDPGVLFASSDRIKRDLGWKPRFEEIDTIVRTAWQWRESRPAGYRAGQGTP